LTFFLVLFFFQGNEARWRTQRFAVVVQRKIADVQGEAQAGVRIIAKLFEWYATGNYSLKALTEKAPAAGLTNRTSGRPLVRAKIHQILQNPIYCGDFQWLGRMSCWFFVGLARMRICC
jgi:hypothetical protein